MFKIGFGETRRSIGIRYAGRTRYYRVKSRVVPYVGTSFVNVLCVLRKALQVDIGFKFQVTEIGGQVCTGYFAEIDGEIFQHKTLGTWKVQEESAIRALEIFINRLIRNGRIELPNKNEGKSFLKRTLHGELVETAG